jgi:hypothetical protein
VFCPKNGNEVHLKEADSGKAVLEPPCSQFGHKVAGMDGFVFRRTY